MSFTRVKTWTPGEVLTASDLNGEFDAITTQDQTLGTPRTSAFNMAGRELIMDADGDSSLTADTDDQIDMRCGGFDVVAVKTVSGADDGLDVTAANAGAPDIAARGASSTIDLKLSPKGAGGLQVGGGSTAAAVVLAQGSATNIGITLTTKGTGQVVFSDDIELASGVGIDDENQQELLSFTTTASAVNQIDIANAATTDGPTISAEGETNVDVRIKGKGTGLVKLGDGELSFPDADGSANQVIQTDGSGALSFVSTGVPQGHLSGFKCVRSSATNIQVTTGQAADATGVLLFSGTGLTKAIGSTWSAGAAGGAMNDTDHPVGNNTWYYVFALSNATGTNVDFGLDTSTTASNLLADTAVIADGLTLYRRVGAIRTNGSAQITEFHQQGDMFIWENASQDVAEDIAAAATPENHGVTVPTGVPVVVVGAVVSASTTGTIYVGSPLKTAEAISGTNLMHARSTSGAHGTQVMVATADGTLDFSTNNNGGDVEFWTEAWIDYRGAHGDA